MQNLFINIEKRRPENEKNKHFLLVYHNKLKKWIPPGGHMLKNELPHETVIRELSEELGIKGKTKMIDPNKSFYNGLNKGDFEKIPVPIAITLYTIPQYGMEPEHLHLDVCLFNRIFKQR